MRRVTVLLCFTLLLPVSALAQANGKLQIHYMDVGQGDAAVLISPLGEVVLFDDGVVNQCGKPVGYLQSLGVTTIDYHIASHYSADHIGCAPSMLSIFPLRKAAYDRGGRAASSTYTAYVAAVGAKRATAHKGQTLTLDAGSANPVTITFVALNGNGQPTATEANRSLVSLVRFGRFDAVFGGDLGSAITARVPGGVGASARTVTGSQQADMVERSVARLVGAVEVYKVHDHGGASSSSATWLASTRPKVAVVSVGTANTQGYPDARALTRLHRANVRTYWTSAGNGAAPQGQDVIAGNIAIVVSPGATTFKVLHDGVTDTYADWGAEAALTSKVPFGSFDTPTSGTVVAGEVGVTGWALDDSGVAGVDLYRSALIGEPRQANGLVFIGTASRVSGARPDIAAAYPTYPGAQDAGWGYMLLSNMLPNQGNGRFTLYTYIRTVDGANVLLGSKTIVLSNATATAPFGTIDTPGQGQVVSGTVTNFGWVLAPQPNSIPLDGSTLDVYIDNVFQGHPTYNNFRSDIATLFPGYANSNGAIGFFTFDSTTFADGVHTIAWGVRDAAGHTAGIGSRYFTVANVRSPQITIQVSPNPLQATTISSSSTSATFHIAPTLTFRETADVAGQITQITSTIIRQPSGASTSGSLAVAVAVPANGTATAGYTQDFDITADVTAVAWRLTVKGTDAHGHPFTATSADIGINPPIVQPPPPPASGRFELWGGSNYTVYLGCFSCGQFVSDSVFNEFGTYGSRYSPTSVSNHFSSYGSPYNTNSACNAFATNPPILVNVSAQRYSELTLNQFRPLAERDPLILSVLKSVICEVP